LKDHKELFVPLSINFLLNYYYGMEKKDPRFLLKAKQILSKPIADKIKWVFSTELKYCDAFYKFETPTYESKYGPQRAKLIKQKISSSMKKLDKNIILERNKSISEYASQRPESHNRNISLSRKRKIIDPKTRRIYNSIEEVIQETKICKTYIRLACQGKRRLPECNFYYLSEFEKLMENFI
jgi:hypothetical protein